ncbi:hypothetical protein Tco_0625277 [Tanacetum coccineum]|uniref:Reverse transcriptase domain-containing protein n=1 Tax=Tanacetum coccineum TaxID=301880 RepID=A0ABQ4WGC1_9ASTR
MPTLRTAEIDQTKNNEALGINLDLIEEKREQAAIQEAKSKKKMEKYYNSRVRGTSFKPGDMVYRSNEASHAKDEGNCDPQVWIANMAEGSREWGRLSGGGGEGLSMVFFELQGKTWYVFVELAILALHGVCGVGSVGPCGYKSFGDLAKQVPKGYNTHFTIRPYGL